LSHSRIWEKEKADEFQAVQKEKRADAESTKKAVKTIQSKVEKTTLGDLGVLADLKKKMDNNQAQEENVAPEASVQKSEEVKTKEAVPEKKATSRKKKEPTIEAGEEDKTSTPETEGE
jgi:hypothetical protein